MDRRRFLQAIFALPVAAAPLLVPISVSPPEAPERRLVITSITRWNESNRWSQMREDGFIHLEGLGYWEGEDPSSARPFDGWFERVRLLQAGGRPPRYKSGHHYKRGDVVAHVRAVNPYLEGRGSWGGDYKLGG
jgi:hypothetical protein